MTDPENVPLPDDVRWELARKEPATRAQVDRLLDLAPEVGVNLEELYGDGYSTPQALSKWAAHWGIDVLESRFETRAFEEAQRAVDERLEQRMKAMIAEGFRAKHPGRYPRTGASW